MVYVNVDGKFPCCMFIMSVRVVEYDKDKRSFLLVQLDRVFLL